MIDVRFPTALQIMLSLALAEQQSVPHLASSQLAESLGANPSFRAQAPCAARPEQALALPDGQGRRRSSRAVCSRHYPA